MDNCVHIWILNNVVNQHFPNDNCLVTQTHTRGKICSRARQTSELPCKKVWKIPSCLQTHLHPRFHCCVWSLGSVTGICRMTCRAIPGLPSLLWVTSQHYMWKQMWESNCLPLERLSGAVAKAGHVFFLSLTERGKSQCVLFL